MTILMLRGDALHLPLRDESVHCCVTSPPYYGLRDYGVAGQIGLERTLDEYVAKMVAVFREVWRVLRKDGCCFLNLGDSYATGGRGGGADGSKQQTNVGALLGPKHYPPAGLKPKDLCGIPWRVAFALQADGWWLRSEIVWSKPNPMPESVTDRPTKAHEYIFLLSKSERYYWDQEAVREKAVAGWNGSSFTSAQDIATKAGLGKCERVEKGGRNIRSVWTIATEPFPDAHFAVFPTEIPRRCILAGTSEKGCCSACGAPWVRVTERAASVPAGETHGKVALLDKQEASRRMADNTQAYRAMGGNHDNPFPIKQTIGWSPSCSCSADVQPCLVLDPFAGSFTTGLVADRLGRHAIGADLNAVYVSMGRDRVVNDAPLLHLEAAR